MFFMVKSIGNSIKHYVPHLGLDWRFTTVSPFDRKREGCL
jgi:hypothetical protein